MLGSLFRREERAIGSVPWSRNDSGWGFWPGDGGGPTWSGAPVDSMSALQLLTVYGCSRLITDQIATLPVDVYQKSANAAVEVPTPEWLYSPTRDLTWADWTGQILMSLLLEGNGYAAITRDSSASIVEMIPLDPTVVKPYRNSPGDRKRYRINGAEVPGLEVLHLKAVMRAGSEVGLAPVEAARQSIGLGLAAQKYGAEFFAGEGNMPGVIEAPGAMQPDTMRDLAQQWRRKRSQGGRGLPGVLQGGAQWKPTGVTNEQAQFLASRKFTAAEIAGQMFLVDPSDLGIPVEGSNLTYANLEQRNIRRVQVTLLPWIIKIETAINSLLSRATYMKLNVDGLLRGDTLSRFQAYEIGSQIGVLTVDEMRALEDLGPLSAEDKKQSRAWQEVGLPALVDSGLMTPNEARAQLGLPPVPGGNVPRDPVAGGSNDAAA